MMTKATIRVPGLKVAVPLAADALPRDLVPMEGPAGEPTIELVLEGGNLTAQAKLNGKNLRKLLKQIAEQGAGNVAVVLQGVLRPPAVPQSVRLDCFPCSKAGGRKPYSPAALLAIEPTPRAPAPRTVPRALPDIRRAADSPMRMPGSRDRIRHRPISSSPAFAPIGRPRPKRPGTTQTETTPEPATAATGRPSQTASAP